jgi:rubrerythrin
MERAGIQSHRRNGCPACWQSRRAAVQSVVAPERSLSHRAPWLVAELHPTRNPGLNPDTLGARSNRRVWWACRSCGHEWQALVSSRSVGNSCPQCARRRQRERGPRPVSKERSLAARRPELVAELHPTRTPDIDPTTLGAGSGFKAWWRCAACGHDWAATVRNRANGSGCPRCARKPNTPTDTTLGAKLSEHLHRVVDAGEGTHGQAGDRTETSRNHHSL